MRRRSAVGVLDVPVGGLDRDPERARDLLCLQAVGEHRDHLDLAVGEPRRTLDARRSLARGLEHCGNGVGVKLSGVRLPGEDSRRPLGRQRLTVGSRLGHRVVGVSRAEQPRGNAELRTGRPAVMAGSVEALVMCLRDRG
jgi:hypothetical protein